MQKNAPILVGILVFAAVVAGWILTLPSVFSHVTKGKGGLDAVFSDLGSIGAGAYADLKTTGETMQAGIDKIAATVNAAERQNAAVNNLKTKIEIQQKLRAALVNAPTNVNSANVNQPKP
jgi:hypothetical protein